MEFKVGDLIKGKPGNPYNLTNDKSICKVIGVYRDSYEDLEVKIIEHDTDKSFIGNQYMVESKYFVPYMTHNYIEV